MPITLNGTTGITTPTDTATTSVTTPLLTSPAATALSIQSAGTTAITVSTSQNVGIGTTSPAAKLDIGSGNLNFSGTGQRITGDMSNATYADRLSFQTSTANSGTSLQVLPNGTAQTALLIVYNTSDPTNSGYGAFYVTNFNCQIDSGVTGTGTYVPLLFKTGGSERMRIDSSGNVNIATSGVSAKLYVSGNSASNIYALTDGTTITPDFSTGNNFSVTLGGNRTLANPTNMTVGQSGIIYVTQDGTGSRTLAYGGYWKFPGGAAPVLTTTASATDALVYTVRTSTSITVTAIFNIG